MKRECLCSVRRLNTTDGDAYPVLEIVGDRVEITSSFPVRALAAIEAMIENRDKILVRIECDSMSGETTFTLLPAYNNNWSE